MALVFDNCCFCLGLRVGSLIIGYLNLVWNILSAVVIVLDDDTGRVIQMIEGKQAVEADPIISVVILTSLFVIGFMFTILLLVGLHQEKRGFVQAYLIYTTIGIVLISLLYVVGMILTSVVLWGKIFEVLVEIYFLLVIRSHYLKMGLAANKQLFTDYNHPKEQLIAYKV